MTSLHMRCYHQRRIYTMTQIFLIFLLMFKTGSLAKINQSDVLKTFLSGDSVRLECLTSEEDGNYYNWIKIIIGQAPELMLSLYTHSNTAKFFGEFNNDTRFTAMKSGTSFVLTISDARPSDMGMYYCASRDYDAMIFGKGVFLMYGVSRNHHLTQQPVSESVQPGDSVTLNCTIDTKTCLRDHSVYWFRQGSGESHPGIIYTHGDRSDQCEKSPEAGSPTQSCVYNLPKRNLSLSDAGTYYCAVVSCGEILFGNGTKLDVGDPADLVDPKLLALIVSNILSLIAVVVLLICVRSKKGLPQQPQSGVTAPSCPDKERDEGEELNYAAMSFSSKKTKRRAEPERQTRERDMNVVYSEETLWDTQEGKL
uniref:Novel immune-type receptor 12 n=1 Tax=Hucho hucho TaxID=62062 RepID=A0A4W5RKY5_9TELE